jgi:hypothetical protein
MAELKIEGELSTAELATFGILPPESEKPEPVKKLDPESHEEENLGKPLDKTAAGPMTLFSESEMTEFRAQWNTVQTGFVDEPRRTVADADKLVAVVMQRLAEGFANERSGLEKQWGRGDDVSTEDLRLALQRYRSFFDRLLRL